MEERKFNNLQMTALVVLRVMIGWHFLYEGVAKLMKGNWSAAGFLLQSKSIIRRRLCDHHHGDTTPDLTKCRVPRMAIKCCVPLIG